VTTHATADIQGDIMPESSATADDAAADDATVDDATADEPEKVEPEVFANRAARRAKGKSSASPEIVGNGKRPIGRSGVQSPRQYGTRRSG
jgi:hypothetical protein